MDRLLLLEQRALGLLGPWPTPGCLRILLRGLGLCRVKNEVSRTQGPFPLGSL